ncbi:hypothetical protein PS2_003240 [Malus domestica]
MTPSSLPLIPPTSSPPPGADRHTITVFKADLLDVDAVAKEQTWKEEERDRLKQKEHVVRFLQLRNAVLSHRIGELGIEQRQEAGELDNIDKKARNILAAKSHIGLQLDNLCEIII